MSDDEARLATTTGSRLSDLNGIGPSGDITALLLNDLIGRDLVVCEVHLGGEQHGFDWWNRLASGIEVDLTRKQFRRGQTLTSNRLVRRPVGRPAHRYREYLLCATGSLRA